MNSGCLKDLGKTPSWCVCAVIEISRGKKSYLNTYGSLTNKKQKAGWLWPTDQAVQQWISIKRRHLFQAAGQDYSRVSQCSVSYVEFGMAWNCNLQLNNQCFLGWGKMVSDKVKKKKQTISLFSRRRMRHLFLFLFVELLVRVEGGCSGSVCGHCRTL